MTELEFPAMGGTIEVQIVDANGHPPGEVQALFAEHEQRLSRFLPDSELCALNDANSAPFVASPMLYEAVSDAVGWACVSDGIFDPTVIDDLEALGYDRTFDEVRGGAAIAPPARRTQRRWAGIEFDNWRNVITLPRNVRIDLGGIGKGYTVDHAIAALGRGANAMVNASGDLYAAGAGPEGQGWYVGVQDPRRPDDDVAVINVNDRGVATSGSIRRYWNAGDTRYHHLIDTRRGLPADSALLTVTTVALTATHADVLAKIAFVLGARDGLRFVERFPDAECLAITVDGDLLSTSGMADYLA